MPFSQCFGCVTTSKLVSSWCRCCLAYTYCMYFTLQYFTFLTLNWQLELVLIFWVRGEGAQGRMQRGPIFNYPDIILCKSNYSLPKLRYFTLSLLCIATLITIQLYPTPVRNFFFLLAVEKNCFSIKSRSCIKVSGVIHVNEKQILKQAALSL